MMLAPWHEHCFRHRQGIACGIATDVSPPPAREGVMREPIGEEVLEALSVGVAVVDAEGEIRLRNGWVERLVSATALADPARLVRRLSSLAQRCRASGDVEVESFEPTDARGADGVRASARPLRDGGAVVTLEPMASSEEVEERVRRFVAQLIHDLRTPLTSILGSADLLLSGRVGTPDERHERLLKIVSEGTQRMATLLTELTRKYVDPEVRP
jgi:signal transduction histidine kinase